ncbi:conserved hypothetical protein [Uncinocarpus reesii 1704]|uniref:Signal peptidase complex subunit 2 n=1 Tax=Uncinocarpus reesii (strain UAMH 1704) TaxID=336963 RepID=C4JIV9_UNCRE|nr:uncharacterized protein UREG_01566 [Uncinocarpus reesii 1704]EEP76717.1 conserved hypothetical protein [Uncinocarpus reesii 1704]
MAKIPVYSLNDLKSTTDDAVTPYLTSLPKPCNFVAINTKSNVRLILGYAAVSIAAVSFYVDYTKGWEATKPWILPAVIAYFALNLGLTIWIWGVEAGQVFEGMNNEGMKLWLCSSTKKQSALYKLRILRVSSSGKVVKEKTAVAPFTRWFSADGVFHCGAFRQWLASEIGIPAPTTSEQ